MTPDKQTPEEKEVKAAPEKPKQLKLADVFKVKAVGKVVLPVVYRGKLVRVTCEKAVEFKRSDLPYESLVNIKTALTSGHIQEVK